MKMQAEDGHLQAKRKSLEPFPHSPQKEGLGSTWLWASGLQNCEPMSFYWWRFSVCGALLQQPSQSNAEILEGLCNLRCKCSTVIVERALKNALLHALYHQQRHVLDSREERCAPAEVHCREPIRSIQEQVCSIYACTFWRCGGEIWTLLLSRYFVQKWEVEALHLEICEGLLVPGINMVVIE